MTKIRVEASDDEQSSACSVADSFPDSSKHGHSSSDEETEAPATSAKKAKKSFKPDALASAFQTVLRQTLPKSEAAESATGQPEAPILLRRKAVERNIEEEELDRKAKKLLKAQIRAAQDAMHMGDVTRPEALNYERSLRKLATRGVVQLFNAIKSSQHQKEEDELRFREQKRIDARAAILQHSRLQAPVSNSPNGDAPSASSASYLDFLKHSTSKKA